jgi:formate dehydrogenase major subunit
MLPPNVAYDLSLQHPRSVFQLLKQQYSRYTPEMVERITGIPKDQFLKAADLFTSIRKDGDMKKGRHDHLCGWLDAAHFRHADHSHGSDPAIDSRKRRTRRRWSECLARSLEYSGRDRHGWRVRYLSRLSENPAAERYRPGNFLKRTTPTASKPNEWDSYNYWSNTPKFMVSFLKSLYGDSAKKENDFNYHHLPKIDRKFSWTEMWDEMYSGKVKGLFAFGMNGVAIGPNSRKNIEALKKADFLVVCELYPEETAEFWQSPGHHERRDEADQYDCLSSAGRRLRGEGRHVR